jgi:glycerophosphoryl diester phosphodiesterase
VALLPENAFLLSSEPGALRDVREVRTIQHVLEGTSISEAARYAWGIGMREDLVSRRGIERAHALGLAATVFTVNEPARMLELAELGVDGIYTDRPDLLRRTLARAPLPAPAAARRPG